MIYGYGYDMYLVDDKVVAITTPEYEAIPVDGFPTNGGTVDGIGVDDVTDPPETEPSKEPAPATAQFIAEYYYQPRVQITVIDVADRANPHVLSRTQLDGNINTFAHDRQPVVPGDGSLSGLPAIDCRICEQFRSENGGVSDIIPNIKVDVDGVNVVDADVAQPTDFYRPVDQMVGDLRPSSASTWIRPRITSRRAWLGIRPTHICRPRRCT
ncbi:MAG: hypothetical protein R3E58_12160 [Phycisphaerae bacterium]